jgi:hypothetical protein
MGLVAGRGRGLHAALNILQWGEAEWKWKAVGGEGRRFPRISFAARNALAEILYACIL